MDKNYCRKSIFKDSTALATDIVTRCITANTNSCLDSDVDLDQKEDCFTIDLHQIMEELRGTIK